jgi:DNA polymerase-3 subunit epsilon
MDRLIDTLMLARRKHPAGPNSLDALCKRYGVDNSKRAKHGALLDCALLAEVYVELLGERQAAFGLVGTPRAEVSGHMVSRALQRPRPLAPRITLAAESAHCAFVETLGPNAVWRRYLTTP